MKLSILDQSPISSGRTAAHALQESAKLAHIGENLGYSRFWIAEHHDFSGLACSAPEVMLGYIGAQTTTIRLGAGAVLLPHYKPYRVAETYNLLASLFPGRIDLGIGRAPGGSAEASIALSNNFLENVRKMPESIKELLHFLYQDFPPEHMFSKISASPLPSVPPEPWILGTSEKSAILAAEQGTAYAFGHFMSEKNGPELLDTYQNHFRPIHSLQHPKSMIAVSVICAETTEKAEEVALSGFLWNLQKARGLGGKGIPSLEEAKKYSFSQEEESSIQAMKKKMVIGNPSVVKEQLMRLQSLYHADELMIITITHDFSDRITSYELLAKKCFN